MKTEARHTPTQARRYLGLDLAGAKNQKTALATLEYYPKEQKIFLLDVFDRITPHDDQSPDEALLEVISEIQGVPSEVTTLGVNVPLTLPPCIDCVKKTCPLPDSCTVSSVKWMRELTKKSQRSGKAENEGIRILEFTPYTQRPSELWVRYQVMPELETSHRFEVDEALGGNKAPLTARMHFLKRHLPQVALIEAWPKLTIAILASELGIPRRTISNYRQLEEGVHARADILEAMTKRFGIFIYERDLRKLSQSLAAFDAFACAYTALLSDTDRCARVANGFPEKAGWVSYPKL